MVEGQTSSQWRMDQQWKLVVKNIAIFLDGTWNMEHGTWNKLERTNVILLARTVPRTTKDGTSQVVLYCPGVGTSYKAGVIPRSINRLGGGAFGWGLDDQIMQAYQHLAMNYEPGDRIFVFGFSRGAFAASSLVGLIRYCGLPTQQELSHIPESLRQYRTFGNNNHPDDAHFLAFRRHYSPAFCTSKPDKLARDIPSSTLAISYLGLWDMVGALGIPHFLPFARAVNRRLQYHSSNLMELVAAARHAVALDETRRTFPVTLWNNWEKMNENLDEPRYFQQFFPGRHSNVGGGTSRTGLSSITNHWIAFGASEAGLEIDYAQFDRLSPRFDIKDCAFRSIRPVIPITSGHLNRAIRPPLFSGCEA